MNFSETNPSFQQEMTTFLAELQQRFGIILAPDAAYEKWKTLAREYSYGDMSLTFCDFENCLREEKRRGEAVASAAKGVIKGFTNTLSRVTSQLDQIESAIRDARDH